MRTAKTEKTGDTKRWGGCPPTTTLSVMLAGVQNDVTILENILEVSHTVKH